MGNYEHKDGSFSAFENKKEKPEHADFRGDGKYNGEPVWVNLWKKKDKNGKTYLSGSIRLKIPKESNKDASPYKPRQQDDLADDLPW